MIIDRLVCRETQGQIVTGFKHMNAVIIIIKGILGFIGYDTDRRQLRGSCIRKITEGL